MGSELARIMKDAAAPPSRELDMRAARERGNQVRRRTRAFGGALTAAAIFITAAGANHFMSQEKAAPDSLPNEVAPAASLTPLDQQAEVFALRALAHTGLLDANGELYDIRGPAEASGEGWTIPFQRLFCSVIDGADSCRPAEGGESRERADAFVSVVLIDGEWQVTATEGNFDADDALRLRDVSLPQTDEAPQWDLPAPTVDSRREFGIVEVVSIWTGPLDYDGPGTICRLTTWDDDGTPKEDLPTYQPPPASNLDRTSGFMIEGWHAGAVDAEYDCHPFEGAGWQPDEDVKFEKLDGAVHSGVKMRWQGQQVINGESKCVAQAMDADGRAHGRDVRGVMGIDDRTALQEGKPLLTEANFMIEVNDPSVVDTVMITCRPGRAYEDE